MYDFLNAINDFREPSRNSMTDRHGDRELGTVLEVVINTTRSKIGSAFSAEKKIPAKIKACAQAQ